MTKSRKPPIHSKAGRICVFVAKFGEELAYEAHAKVWNDIWIEDMLRLMHFRSGEPEAIMCCCKSGTSEEEWLFTEEMVGRYMIVEPQPKQELHCSSIEEDRPIGVNVGRDDNLAPTLMEVSTKKGFLNVHECHCSRGWTRVHLEMAWMPTISLGII